MRLPPDPLGDPRHPLVVYFLIAFALNGAATFLGYPTTNAIANALDGNTEVLWGALLFTGSTAVLAGMFWPWDVRDGLLLKRFGWLCLALSALIFGIIVGITVGRGGAFTTCAVIGLGVACGLQWLRVNRHIHKVITESPK